MHTRQQGFSLIEMLVAITILMLAMTGLASLLIQNSRVNKAQQMTVEVQGNARNTLSLVVNKLRSAGWNPADSAGVGVIATDADLSNAISEITIFGDYNMDGDDDDADEEVMIRHTGNQVVWRPTAAGAFVVVANNISNDADGDGVIEPMFVPDNVAAPTRITVQVTARSTAPDPNSGDFIRYTVSSDVVLRKEL